METKTRAIEIARLLEEKKGRDVLILNMQEASLMADYFILASANNSRQTKALANYVDEYMTQKDLEALRVEGKGQGSWLLIDYGDLVVHLFTDEMRSYYDLERLWKDADRLDY